MNAVYPILLYDGVCGFCNRTVQTILKYDRRKTLRFAPLQSELAKQLLAGHPDLHNVDTVVLIEAADRLYVRSTAALRIASYLGGFWKMMLIGYIVPRPIRDLFYGAFAKVRYRLFGKFDTCMLPPKESRERFLDVA